MTTQRRSRSKGKSNNSHVISSHPPHHSAKDEATTTRTSTTATTVTPYEILQIGMKTDRKIMEYETLIRPSEYYAERSNEVQNTSNETLNRIEKERLRRSCQVDKDPLIHWMNYINYLKDHYPLEQQIIWKTYHRCVCALVHHEEYKSDQRFVRLCVMHADHCQDSLKRFEYLYKMKVGISLAMMWMCWAWTTEKDGDFAMTRNIFLKALEKEARPVNVVQERFEQFQLRMKRRSEELSIAKDKEDCRNDTSGSSKSTGRSQTLVTSVRSGRTGCNDASVASSAHTGTKQSNESSSLHQDRGNSTVLPSVRMDSTSRQTVYKRQKVDLQHNLQQDINKFREISNCNLDQLRNGEKRHFKSKQKHHLVLGFHKNLVSIDAQRNETCFERERARTGKYSQCLQPNFNMLHFEIQHDGLDYNILHQRDTEHAIQMLTSSKWHESTRGAVHWQFDQNLPRCLAKPTKKGGSFTLDGFEYNLLHKLGSGSCGTVFLCRTKDQEQSQEHDRFALKVQHPVGCLAWEFKVLGRLKDRVTDNNMFPKASSINFFSNGGAIQMTAGSESGFNLLDVVNLYKGNVPELIAIHYTHRMLCTLEELHLRGKFLHADVKPDNWIIRNHPEIVSDLMLIDFGRAVELSDKVMREGLRGRVAAEDLECIAMRNERKWCFDIDCFGLCVCSHTLLFGTYMELVKTRGNKWILKEPLRRYWQTPLWRLLFDSFINIEALDVGTYAKKLDDIKQAFAMHLAFKKRELKQLLLNLNTLLPHRKI